MMEEVAHRPTLEYIPPPLPLKVKQKNSTFTQISNGESKINMNGYKDGLDASLSSMHPLVLNSKSTVFLAATQSDQPASESDARQPSDCNGRHVVTIRINNEIDKKPKISSVHLKSESEFDPFKLSELNKKNNSLVRLNADENLPKILEHNEFQKADKDKPPFIFCNSYSLNSMTNMVMSSGQCSPSDTLDSGTCSDLDSTPPPLPKKKTSKSSAHKKAVTVTLISPTNNGNNHNSEVDFEDNDSNISCDSLNSSELNGSVHTDESNIEDANKKEKKQEPPTAPHMPSYPNEENNKDNSFLPRGLLQDIRDRSAKLSNIETESEIKADESRTKEANQNTNANANLSKESAELTSFRLVTQFNNDKNCSNSPLLVTNANKSPIISESTYEERKKEDQSRQRKCYSGKSFDADKYYDFHLNEKQFDNDKSIKSVNGVSAKSGSDDADDVEYFAGVKDYKTEEAPSTIRSSKGTIRGVKNRVRAGIATFLQMQNTSKSYKEKDAGKVVIYTTTMGIVRSTYQRCVLVKKILRNLLVKYEERDVFMSLEYQDEIRDRMKSDQIMVPQLFIDGQHVGDADTVEKLNESGDLRKMLKPYKSPDACNTCQMCGGFRLLPCRICNGSKKSLHRNHFTAEFVALKCMNCDEVGLVRCEAC